MTIYHRVKVWLIKGFRLAMNAFKWVRPRTYNAIFTERVIGNCDYCELKNLPLAVLEADYEVYPKICGNCLDACFRVLYPKEGFEPRKQQSPSYTKDHRGVVVQ